VTPAPAFRRLPDGKAISPLGFGCASIWARPSFDGGEAARILDAAFDHGINHLDTAPSYGLGHGESRLGGRLRKVDPSRLVISTKVGTNLVDGAVVRSFARAVMRRSFEASLRRLGVEHVDILYLHGPSAADLNDEVLGFFEELKGAGLITYSGVNSFDPAVLRRAIEVPVDSVMLQYNVADTRLASVLDALDAAGKFVISATALGRAVFNPATFLPADRVRAWYLARMLRRDPGALLRGRRVARDLAATGKPASDAAIQFVVGQPKILSSLFGTTKVAHLVANVRAAGGRLTESQWASLAGAHAAMRPGAGAQGIREGPG
jgi:aryl-alcohol dehydrogenase-like predicted oxidoreductase